MSRPAVQHHCGAWVRRSDLARHTLACPANAKSRDDPPCHDCGQPLPQLGGATLLEHKRHHCTRIVNGCQSLGHFGDTTNLIRQRNGQYLCMSCMEAEIRRLERRVEELGGACQSGAHSGDPRNFESLYKHADGKYRCSDCHKLRLQRENSLLRLELAVALKSH